MKSTIIKKDQLDKLEFPCLMQYTDTGEVLLVTGVGTSGAYGTIVAKPPNSCFRLGETRVENLSDGWTRKNLAKFAGEIILSSC